MLWIALYIIKYTPQKYFLVITTLSLIACIIVFAVAGIGIGDCMVFSCSYVAAWKRKECF